ASECRPYSSRRPDTRGADSSPGNTENESAGCLSQHRLAASERSIHDGLAGWRDQRVAARGNAAKRTFSAASEHRPTPEMSKHTTSESNPGATRITLSDLCPLY